jgi:hypothetical protein
VQAAVAEAVQDAAKELATARDWQSRVASIQGSLPPAELVLRRLFDESDRSFDAHWEDRVLEFCKQLFATWTHPFECLEQLAALAGKVRAGERSDTKHNQVPECKECKGKTHFYVITGHLYSVRVPISVASANCILNQLDGKTYRLLPSQTAWNAFYGPTRLRIPDCVPDTSGAPPAATDLVLDVRR